MAGKTKEQAGKPTIDEIASKKKSAHKTLKQKVAKKVTRKKAVRKKAWRRDRAGKEDLLMQAFDRVLQRDGIQGVGINQVLKEAGVGKSLLYEYFGGLQGLAAAWAKKTDFLPTDEELAGADAEAYARLSTAEQLIGNYQQFARALRRRPRTLEVLANELTQPTELTRTLESVRSEYGKELTKFFTRPEEYSSDEAVAVQMIMYAAVNYLALRARTSPRYFHLRLDSEEGWRSIEEMIALVVRRLLKD
jgi:AcrR family transcriptional regulator